MATRYMKGGGHDSSEGTRPTLRGRRCGLVPRAIRKVNIAVLLVLAAPAW